MVSAEFNGILTTLKSVLSVVRLNKKVTERAV